MDIFEVAKHMEKEGEKYYRELAGQTEDVGLKNIFTSLAEDEVKHYQIFQEMGQGEIPHVVQSSIVDDVRDIFHGMRERAKGLTGRTPQQEVYRIAVENEQHSIDAYLKMFDEAEDERHRQVLQKIIEEEKKHVLILQNLIEFVRRPDVWLEDAEFNNLTSY